MWVFSKLSDCLNTQLKPFPGATLTGKALGIAKEMLNSRRADVLTIVLVVTDGYSFDPVDLAAKEIHAFKDVISFAVAIPDLVRE